jgi:hypothetical protein
MTIKKIVTLGAAISAASFLAQPASAAWLYQTKESAFDDGTMYIAATAGTQGGFAVRCQGGEMDVVYMIANTDFGAENVEKGNSLGLMKLKLRVDKGEVLTLDAVASVPDNGMLMLKAEINKTQAEQIRDAKKAVAAALTMGGQNFYEGSFSASGSTDVLGKVLSQCRAEDAAAFSPE